MSSNSWFYLSKQNKKHYPEICTDAPLTFHNYTYYSQFKSCHNVSSECSRKALNKPIYDSNAVEALVENTYTIKSQSQSDCNNKHSIGPLFVRHLTKNESRVESSSATCFLHRVIFSHITFIFSQFCFIFLLKTR